MLACLLDSPLQPDSGGVASVETAYPNVAPYHHGACVARLGHCVALRNTGGGFSIRPVAGCSNISIRDMSKAWRQ